MYQKGIIREDVQIGVRCDNVGFPLNFATKEFGVIVDLGMTPLEVIITGTKVNVVLLTIDDRQH